MVQQNVLPFKLEITKDIITPHAGLALFGEFCVSMGLLKYTDKYIPGPGSGAGYNPSEYIYPLLLMLHGGGRSLEDIRKIKEDTGLREILPLKIVPSSGAIGDWLRRTGSVRGLMGLQSVNARVLKRYLKKDGIKEYTLDIDATGIEAEKESAKKTYKGFKGYMPIVGHLAENGLIIGDDFREGNRPPSYNNFEFLRHCIGQMPKGEKVKAFRADSASYQAKIISYCEKKKISFAIGADLDKSVVRSILHLTESEWKEFKGNKIAEFVHSMEKTEKAFRMIVIRRPCQKPLFDESSNNEYKYTVIATNRSESPDEVVKWYNQRGECSENRIKELKIGFAMERMPCGQLEANAVFFRIGSLAYNIYRLFLLKTLDPSWHKHQVQTVRWRLYHIAGKIVYHANQTFLKVRRGYYRLFSEVRRKTWEVGCA